MPRAARGARQPRGHSRAEASVRALEAEQVESGEHATDDIVARRGGTHASADGRCDARAELAGVSLAGEAGELLRALTEVFRTERVGQAAIEFGDLRRRDTGAVDSGNAQLYRGRCGVPCPQVDRRRRVESEFGPAGEDRGQGDPIG